MRFVPRRLEQTGDISRGKPTLKSSLKYLLSVVIILGLGYFLLGLAADGMAASISEETEVNLFRWSFEDVENPTADFERAREIFEKMSGNALLRPLEYRLFLVDYPDPNAFALPGGSVGLSTGLLERLDSEIGLATVIGHELGHHQGRDCLKRIGRALVLRGVFALVFGSGDVHVVQGALDLAESSYSREQELAADAFGLRLVKETYGHTEGCLEFFEMIECEMGSRESPWSALMASHPPTKERIDALRELKKELDAGQ